MNLIDFDVNILIQDVARICQRQGQNYLSLFWRHFGLDRCFDSYLFPKSGYYEYCDEKWLDGKHGFTFFFKF